MDGSFPTAWVEGSSSPPSSGADGRAAARRRASYDAPKIVIGPAAPARMAPASAYHSGGGWHSQGGRRPHPATAVDVDAMSLSCSTGDSSGGGSSDDDEYGGSSDDDDHFAHNCDVATPTTRTRLPATSRDTLLPPRTAATTTTTTTTATPRCATSDPAVADLNSSRRARTTNLACAFKALKCSSRASPEDYEEFSGVHSNCRSDYDANLARDMYDQIPYSRSRSLPSHRCQPSTEDGRSAPSPSLHRLQYAIRQQHSRQEPPHPEHQTTAAASATAAAAAAAGQPIAGLLSDGAGPAPPSEGTLPPASPPLRPRFEHFADFDSPEAATARDEGEEEDAVSSVLHRVAETTTPWPGGGRPVPSAPQDGRGCPFRTNGVEIFSDENDDEEEEVECGAIPGAAAFVARGDGPAAESSRTQPSSSCTPGRQPSNDSNETPTTCNRNPERGMLTPVAARMIAVLDDSDPPHRPNLDGDVGCGGRLGRVAQTGYEMPLKQILHHNLSLGDALSPIDQESPTIRHAVPQGETIELCKDEWVMTNAAVDETLHLPVLLGSKRHVALQHEEKKIDDPEGSHHATPPSLGRDAYIVRRSGSNSHSHRVKARGKLSDVAVDLPFQKGVPKADIGRGDASFSTISSFTISHNDRKPPVSTGQSVLLQTHGKEGHRLVTPHPFFWRSHPTVTFTSYHFQQPEAIVRKIIPKLRPDSFSTLGRNGDIASAPSLSTASLEDNYLKNTSTIRATLEIERGVRRDAGKRKSSPHQHLSVVRNVWIESRELERKANTNWQQHRSDGSNCHPQGPPASRSARDFVHSFASFANRKMADVFNRQQTDPSLTGAPDSPKP